MNNNRSSTLARYQNTYNTLINEINDINDHESLITCNSSTTEQTAYETNNNNKNSDALYGRIRQSNENVVGVENFTYKTLNGDVIRSVYPPGKGNSVNYKVSKH